VVKVRHDVLHALTFYANEIRERYSDIGELDECGAGGQLAADFDRPHADTGVVEEGDNKEG